MCVYVVYIRVINKNGNIVIFVYNSTTHIINTANLCLAVVVIFRTNLSPRCSVKKQLKMINMLEFQSYKIHTIDKKERNNK